MPKVWGTVAGRNLRRSARNRNQTSQRREDNMSLQSAMYLAVIGLLLLALVEAERRDMLRAVIAKVRGDE